MDLSFRARLPPAPYPSNIPTPPPKDEAAERIRKAKEKRDRRRKQMIIASIIIVIVAVSGVYYYLNDSPYETAIVSKTTTTGTITGVSDASYALPAAGSGSRAQTVASAKLVISTSTGSFTTFVSCWPVRYQAGMMTVVTVQTQRNGVHLYSAPNLACSNGIGGGGFPIGIITSSTSSSSTRASTTSASSH